MGSHRLQWWLAIGAMLALPVMAYAQEATLIGTVSDTTGGALPGVTVRAVHEATGNSFEAVTDERGNYRLAVRVGAYRVTSELAGFASVTRTVTLLVGQEGVVNLQMGVSGVQESVTVTGEAPLLDTTQSSLGGNVDPRQLQELPVNGRNWLDLVLMAPGARNNAVTEIPFQTGGTTLRGDFQINVDGQQITTAIGSSANDGQPRYSRDAIAEFEYLSSRFDATQSRSSGIQVNVITKSGTNTASGSFAGYFRDDSMNAADFVAKDSAGKPRVLPYENQQLSGTFGGPLRKDRVHFFANYEYEREPQTLIYTTPYPHFNGDISNTRVEKKAGARLDAQFSPRTRLAVRYSGFRFGPQSPVEKNTANVSPSSQDLRYRQTNQVLATLTQVVSNRVVNEVKAGWAGYANRSDLLTRNPNARFSGFNGTQVQLSGIDVGGIRTYPEQQYQDIYSVRDDFTYSFSKGGRHTLKLGGEYLFLTNGEFRCERCEGTLDATKSGSPALTNELMKTLFPDIFDASTWNLASLSPLTKTFRQAVGNFNYRLSRNSYGLWAQDDWTVWPRLTLNLGLRYDVELGAFGNDVELLPFLPKDRADDLNNVSPRTGFSFSLNDRTVIRGGFGIYFGTVTAATNINRYSDVISYQIPNDGRADFASNPYNGPVPTFEQVLAQVCPPGSLATTCLRREILATRLYEPNYVMPYSYQSSIGFQRQLGPAMAVEADYVYMGIRGDPAVYNINVTYDPVTGVNKPFKTISTRPYPEWGVVALAFNEARYNAHSLQTAFTKRFSNGWQATGTYTLSGLWDGYGRPFSGFTQVPFNVPADLGGDYDLAASDQRHRAVFNGIWQLKYGFQLSGLYFFGSGDRYNTLYGTDLRDIGGTGNWSQRRLRPDGTIVPRSNFVGKPIHRVDLRLQRRFPLGGRAGVDGIVELFNVFNHANYGAYNGAGSGPSSGGGEVSKNYLSPAQNLNLAYAPRTLQLGFRFLF